MEQIKQLFRTAFVHSTYDVPLGVMFTTKRGTDYFFHVVYQDNMEVIDDSTTRYTIRVYVDKEVGCAWYDKIVESQDIEHLINEALCTLGLFPNDQVATRAEIIWNPVYHYWIDFETGQDNFPKINWVIDTSEDDELPVPFSRGDNKKRLRNKKTEKNNKVPRKHATRTWSKEMLVLSS